MAKKKRSRIDASGDEGFGTSLGSLLGIAVETSKFDEATEPKESPLNPLIPEQAGRLSLRVSSKGYGGKTVTECRGLKFETKSQQTALTKMVSRTFGTKAFWKDEVMCVQGDLLPRLAELLKERGHHVD